MRGDAFGRAGVGGGGGLFVAVGECAVLGRSSVLGGHVVAVAIAIISAFGASLLLNDVFQKPVESAFSTGGVRL